jgi:hypothetical protein
MRYMLLMNATQADWQAFGTLTPQDRKAHVAFMKDLDRRLRAAGELVCDDGLSGPAQAQLVRARSGEPPLITAGFPAGKEFLAGYWVIDCHEPRRIVEIAALVSSAPGRGGAPLNFPVEVRPIMGAPGEDIF